MKRNFSFITINISIIFGFFILTNPAFSKPVPPSLTSSATLTQADTKAEVRLSKTYGNLPLTFEANEGHADEQVKFLSRGSGYSLFLTPTETVLSLSKDEQSTAIRMGLMGANPKPKMAGEEKLSGKTNYLIGNDPKKWRTNVSNYKKVRYQEVYPGIDLVYYGNQRKLEYDFIVKPGVDPKAIRMQFAGVDRMSVEAGDLVMHTDTGDLTQKAPIIYQEIDGKRIKVAGNYMFLADNQVGFYLGDYDKDRPLVIDPILEYSTYLGGNGADEGHGIAVDGAGNAYVTGGTGSTDFPTLNALQGANAGGNTIAFVTKLDANGVLVYSTYLGGTDDTDEGNGIAVDGAGNAYVAGDADSTDFPTLNALQGANAGGIDAFVAKLDTNGALVYSTYLGGSGSEQLSGDIAVDGAGNAYVTGRTTSTDFPTLNAMQGAFGGGQADAFVTKLDTNGALAYSTYLGGGSDFAPGFGPERASGIAVDADGNAYVAGWTDSTDFPTLNALQGALAGGGTDAFVTKLDANGTLSYSTFLGGNGTDEGRGIAVDGSGNATVTGNTKASDFPTMNALQGALAGGDEDAFVTKLDTNGALSYSTYLGGSSFDIAFGIAVDEAGNAYVTGITRSTDFPTLDTLQGAFPGDIDNFVTKLDASGALSYSTYLGGSGSDSARGIAVDGSGAAYVTGWTDSRDFPVLNALQGAFVNSRSDAFITKIGTLNQAPTADAGIDQIVEQQNSDGSNVTLGGSGSDPDTDPLTFAWTWPLGSASGPTPTVQLPEGTHIISLVVNDGTVDSDPDTVEIKVQDTTDPVVTPPADITVPATGALTNVAIGTASATDAADPNPTITNDALGSDFPVGTTIVTWTATDAATNEGTATQSVTVVNNTSTGTNVIVDPVDPGTGEPVQEVDLTFDEITSEGTTTAAVTTTGPPSPVGFQLGDPPTFIELETTATFNGLVEVCFDYSGITFTDENNLKLLHFVSSNWVDITTTKDTVNKIICGDTPSFSFFALFEPEAPIDVVVQWARVRLELNSENWDRVKVRGTYSLSPNSDGIDVVNEDVIVKFGDFTQTIPAGSFVSKNNGKKFVYKGSQGGIKQLVIKTNGKFKIKAKGLNLQGIDYLKPVPFSIQIGNDFGEKPIHFLDLKPKVKKFKLLDDGTDEDDEEDEVDFDKND